MTQFKFIDYPCQLFKGVPFKDFFMILSAKAERHNWIAEKVKGEKKTVRIKIKRKAEDDTWVYKHLFAKENMKTFGIHINDMFDSSIRAGLEIEEFPNKAFYVFLSVINKNDKGYYVLDLRLV